jgi:hypothetical protein
MDGFFANWGQVGQLIVSFISLFKRGNSPSTLLPAPTPLATVTAEYSEAPPAPTDENNITQVVAGVARRTFAVGDFWQHSKHLRIAVRKVEELAPSDRPASGQEYAVELEFSENVFSTGANVNRGTAPNRFIFMESNDSSVGPNCVYSIILSLGLLIVSSVRVTHINFHAKTVELEVLKITGRLPDY